MEAKEIRELLLTFDTEDFISQNSISVLQVLLEQLEKYDLKALFFVTGHMAEKLQDYPETANLLEAHEIGYHSSGHSVHPTIFEFTDVESYEQAYRTSMIRETSHINPLTGAVENSGNGGILSLRKLFPTKQVVAFRAPGFCWSPPHTEALRDLGIKFDFSTHISSFPFYHKGLSFYPYPNTGEWQGKLSDYRLLSLSILRNGITITNSHPSLFVNQGEWDSIYWKGNPKHITPPIPKRNYEIKSLFKSYDLLLKRLKHFERIGLIETTPHLIASEKNLSIPSEEVERCYEHSVRWAKRLFEYKPMFLRHHFFSFFDIPSSNTMDRTGFKE